MAETNSAATRVALVTNIPAPYRLPVYDAIGPESGIDLHIVFCSMREPNREWNLQRLTRPHYFLNENFFKFRGAYIHLNLDVIGCLEKIGPDVVITTGFNPTHLFAFAYAIFTGRTHIPMTDGTLTSELTLGRLHRMVRRMVFKRSSAYLAAAEAGLDIYRSYGCEQSRLFRSALCVNNDAFARRSSSDERVDFLFCGRLTHVKNPLFALQVARSVAHALSRRVSICFVGSGPMEDAIRHEASTMSELDVTLPGFATQEELPERYAASRVFLMPSLWDPWGVVANEACAAGLPVIVSPHAGVAGELVRDGVSGFVRALDVKLWSDAAATLLRDPVLYARMSAVARQTVNRYYTIAAAANGIVAAVDFARRNVRKSPLLSADADRRDGPAAHR